MIGSFLLLWQTPGLAQRIGDDPLQLAVGAAELVGSPRLYRIHGVSINAENETLGRLLSHSLSTIN